MRLITGKLGWLFLLLTLSVCVARAQEEPAVMPDPAAGEYRCHSMRLLINPSDTTIVPMFGERATVSTPNASIEGAATGIGSIKLDGKGNYQMTVSKKTGRYAYDNKTTRFLFLSGPLKDWPAAYQTTKDWRILWLSRFPEVPPDQNWKNLGGIKCGIVDNQETSNQPTKGSAAKPTPARRTRPKRN